MVGPSRPNSPISRKMAGSVASWRKACCTRGRSRSWQYAWAASWMARSSSVSWACSRKGSIFVFAYRLAGEQHIGESEPTHVPNPHRIENAVQVVTFMLDHPGVEALHRPVDGLPEWVPAAVPQLTVAGHDAPQARHRKATFPALLHLVPDEIHLRIDEGRVGHGWCLRVALAPFETEDHHPQIDADLRRGDADTPSVGHGVPHVLQQSGEFGRPEGLHGAGHPKQARVAHAQDVADHEWQSVSRMERTRRMASCSTCSMLSKWMPSLLPARPAA